MIDALWDINRDVARTFLGERRGQTISENIGSRLDRTFGLAPGVGKDIFHVGLVTTLLAGGMIGIAVLAD